MSTYVLMRILESSPRRYDLGIRILTLGRIDKVYDRLLTHVREHQQVLDLGCGTGALTLRAAQRGATVKGIDVSPQMLEIAAERVQRAGFEDRVTLEEMGVAELDRERTENYDVVTSGLCFSELSDDELRYTLEQIARILKPNGLLLVADETRPDSRIARAIRRLLRAPLVAVTYLLTQQTTHAIADLPGSLSRAGLSVLSLSKGRQIAGLVECVAQKPPRAPQ